MALSKHKQKKRQARQEQLRQRRHRGTTGHVPRSVFSLSSGLFPPLLSPDLGLCLGLVALAAAKANKPRV